MTTRTRWQWKFTVEGRGRFPFDMLRYDSAWPASEEESPKLGHDHALRQVVLCTRKGEPTLGRWASFGWFVLDVQKEKIP